MTNSGDRQGDDASEVRMICPNDLLIPPNGPMLREPTFTGMTAKKRHEFMGHKVAKFHEIYVHSSINSLFLMPAQWVKRRAGLEPGDLVFMIKESMMKKSYQWGMVKTVYPDSLGVVRTADIRYQIINTGSFEFISVYKKGNVSKVKRCSVQNLSLAYSQKCQEEDYLANKEMALALYDPTDAVLGDSMINGGDTTPRRRAGPRPRDSHLGEAPSLSLS